MSEPLSGFSAKLEELAEVAGGFGATRPDFALEQLRSTHTFPGSEQQQLYPLLHDNAALLLRCDLQQGDVSKKLSHQENF